LLVIESAARRPAAGADLSRIGILRPHSPSEVFKDAFWEQLSLAGTYPLNGRFR